MTNDVTDLANTDTKVFEMFHEQDVSEFRLMVRVSSLNALAATGGYARESERHAKIYPIFLKELLVKLAEKIRAQPTFPAEESNSQ